MDILKMSDKIAKIQRKLGRIRKKREWERFHNPKDLTINASLEVAELLEHFRWKNEEEVKEYSKKHKEKIAEEIADITMTLINLCDVLGVDFIEALDKKVKGLVKKYPASKYKGTP